MIDEFVMYKRPVVGRSRYHGNQKFNINWFQIVGIMPNTYSCDFHTENPILVYNYENALVVNNLYYILDSIKSTFTNSTADVDIDIQPNGSGSIEFYNDEKKLFISIGKEFFSYVLLTNKNERLSGADEILFQGREILALTRLITDNFSPQLKSKYLSSYKYDEFEIAE
jgi:hypothetical protein